MQTPADDYGPNVLFVRFRDGADSEAAVRRLQRDADQIADYNGIAVTPVQRSAEIVNADNVSNSSTLLGVRRRHRGPGIPRARPHCGGAPPAPASSRC